VHRRVLKRTYQGEELGRKTLARANNPIRGVSERRYWFPGTRKKDRPFWRLNRERHQKHYFFVKGGAIRRDWRKKKLPEKKMTLTDREAATKGSVGKREAGKMSTFTFEHTPILRKRGGRQPEEEKKNGELQIVQPAN